MMRKLDDSSRGSGWRSVEWGMEGKRGTAGPEKVAGFEVGAALGALATVGPERQKG
jgi:hypothetical protein